MSNTKHRIEEENMKFIIKYRFYILGLFILLFITGGILLPSVKLNYDPSEYLSEDMPTKKALIVMDEEFGITGYCEVMAEGVSIVEAGQIYTELLALEGVKSVEFNPMNENFYKDENALYKISFPKGNYDEETDLTITNIKTTLESFDIYLRGESVSAIVYNEIVQKEIIKIIIFLLPIVLIILFLLTTSWIEPLLFIIVIGLSVVINMGSNIFFGEISYMTHLSCGILQIALCMDYAVIMLHSYKKNKVDPITASEAVIKASKESFIPILSSMLTTVAGFSALMFMRYKIGLDIGSVLVKGTLISFAATFLVMPGLIVMFAKLIDKSAHKSILVPLKSTYKFINKSKIIIPIIALAVISFAFVAQTKNSFIYSENNIVSESGTLGKSFKKISTTFGNNNDFVILVPFENEQDLQKEAVFITELNQMLMEKNIEPKSQMTPLIFYTKYTRLEFAAFLGGLGIVGDDATQILGIFDLMQYQLSSSSFTILEMKNFIISTDSLSPEQKESLLPFTLQINGALKELESNKYHRIIFTIDIPIESDQTFELVNDIHELSDQHYGEQYYLLGESIGINDMKSVMNKDYIRVTIITIILIFIIILISFRKITIPLLLIILIEGAIWINMAIPAIMGNNLLYVGYIIVGCIMLGATIDYAILYTHRYTENRLNYNKGEAMKISFDESKTTVLTSGLILTFAGFTMAIASSIPSISVFGTLIGRGAIISIIVVLFVLPQTMLLFDKLVITKKKEKIS